MKLVKEFLNEVNNFERSNDVHKTLDVGKDSTTAKEQKYNELLKQYKFFTIYSKAEDNVIAKENYINRIYEIEKFIFKLNDLNIKIKHISQSVTGYTIIQVKVFRIASYNYFISETYTLKSAEKIKDIFELYSSNFNSGLTIIDEDDNTSYIDVKPESYKFLESLEQLEK